MKRRRRRSRRYGLIVRANNKGLGTQTMSLYRNMEWAATLLPLDPGRHVEQFPEWFPDAAVVHMNPDRTFVEMDKVEKFLDSVDVVFSVETLYDPNFPQMCKKRGIPTIVQGNPEFYSEDAPAPSLWTWPTDWRLEHLPDGPVIPVPVPTDCWAKAGEVGAPVKTIVHPMGHRAIGDRNGTDQFVESIRFFRGPLNVRVYGLDGELPELPPLDSGVTVEMYRFGTRDRWQIYDGAHALVLPRRYGGLCLPAIEALTAGLAVVMPNGSPNPTSWPIWPIVRAQGPTQRTPAGHVETHFSREKEIGQAVNRLIHNDGNLAAQMAKAPEWVAANTWDKLRPNYIRLLEETEP